ncbi:MAG: DEAD/DEAH box helicase family protein, partial [Firmicutes bacterium]|nr:DEAD/DEAH box helicase family protein [Bacillota bacterium]
IDPASAVINCRRAMEFAVKWMYSVDKDLQKPYDTTLAALMSAEEFRDIVGEDLYKRMDFIRKTGNIAAHGGKRLSVDQAKLCIENLYIFMDFVACCYAGHYEERPYDPALLESQSEPVTSKYTELDFEKLQEENKNLREQLTARREEQKRKYVPKPLDLSEFETRKIYIDTMLADAGWVEGENWLNEVELHGMPNKTGIGYADYVLYDDTFRPLAVIEAKRTCKDVAEGRQQAKLYADILEKMYGRRPVIFLTNGFETRIEDGQYPERKVAAVYSKRDLEKMFNLRGMRTSLKNVVVDKDIAGRYYQDSAVKAVCNAFDSKNRRKALLDMATGSGKTRTVIALCKVLLDYGWIRNILFLADRTSLVIQAKRAFVNLLPDLSVTNLCEEKDNFAAHCVFSTYQTMYNCIDETRDEEGKLFTSGHFDLVICDEAHRSIYNKYRDIFNYFDAPLVGLTATPKDEIDKNTYEIFGLENGVPTYGYELAQAVKDGYLVDFEVSESRMKFIEQGITYDDLSDDEKEEYENLFADENGEIPEHIDSSALNEWIFNYDTIRQVLNEFMTNGIKIEYGSKLGKTIVFAKNHIHAEKILEVFNEEYPHLNGFAKVIDNRIRYAQSLIDEFSDPKKMPQIAISVDMLDTGIDVPEVVNLVFFKKVMSKAKFWQMIGRGTRLCPGLLDGEDKNKFYIFDFCGNFEFFRMSGGKPTANQMALQGAIFNLKAQIVFKLQDAAYQTDELIEFRKTLVNEMVSKVRELNKENFAVKQHLKYVELYSNKDNYVSLTYEDTLNIKNEISSLIIPDNDEVSAVRFDALMYGIELAYLVGKGYGRYRKDFFNKVRGVASVANIPEITAKSYLIDKILNTDYFDNCGINEFEFIRKALRNLMKYIIVDPSRYDTHFADDILSVEWNGSELENDDLENYKKKAEYYVREHQDNHVIAKLRGNIPLTKDDVAELEGILWSEVGTKEQYEAQYGEKPLGEFVREIVGLEMNAAKEAFADFLSRTNLDSKQIYFVNQIVEYIVYNGVMKDFSVLQETPFTDKGSIAEVFKDVSIWYEIRGIIGKINENAAA